MSRILDLAEAVAAALADYSAEVLFIPEFDLKGTKETRVIVVPAGTEFKALSRASHEARPCVHVGVLRRATEDDVPALVEFAQALGRSFLNRRLAGMTCTGVAFDPVYSPTHLRDKGLFVSVMELTFQGAA